MVQQTHIMRHTFDKQCYFLQLGALIVFQLGHAVGKFTADGVREHLQCVLDSAILSQTSEGSQRRVKGPNSETSKKHKGALLQDLSVLRFWLKAWEYCSWLFYLKWLSWNLCCCWEPAKALARLTQQDVKYFNDFWTKKHKFWQHQFIPRSDYCVRYR